MRRGNEDTIEVSEEADIILAGQRARAMLTEHSFAESTLEEVVLVVHELASNIIKHAGEGSITLVTLIDEDQNGIEIRARDSGPGITDIDQAIVDGYSTAGGLGRGLGTVHRLMDEVVLESKGNPKVGVEIVATRWQSSSSTSKPSPTLAIGAATQAKPGCDQNGDTNLIDDATVVIIEGSNQ